MSPEFQIQFLNQDAGMLPKPGRRDPAMTELSGGFPAEQDKIVPAQVPDDLVRVQPVQNLRPVERDEGGLIHDFDERARRGRSIRGNTSLEGFTLSG
jgi:hypothetical protein